MKWVKKQSQTDDETDCPDLTFIWNRAAQLANQKKISVYEMNEVWGALRTLEIQGFCKLAESTYD